MVLTEDPAISSALSAEAAEPRPLGRHWGDAGMTWEPGDPGSHSTCCLPSAPQEGQEGQEDSVGAPVHSENAREQDGTM